MKLLMLCALLCVLALTGAAAKGADGQVQQPDEGLSHKRSCPCSWSEIYGSCFRYFSSPMSWTAAERHCQSIGGNLASVHNFNEHNVIQGLIRTTDLHSSKVWIGGTDAQQDGVWFWSDGSTFQYAKWCPGEPNNHLGPQNCLQVNSALNCWDDCQCHLHRPFVCVKIR